MELISIVERLQETYNVITFRNSSLCSFLVLYGDRHEPRNEDCRLLGCYAVLLL
jgi:hypothetical protein